jgi:ribosome-binding protein aMBF1 (putative translation factor)
VRNEELSQRIEEKDNILHTIKRRKADPIGHMLRRNCLLKHIIEEKIEKYK